MASNLVKKISIYKWRFWIGYAALGLLMLGIITSAAIYVPGGISEAEKLSVIKSASLNIKDMQSLAITDLPYHATQKLSLHFFGLSSLSIKLPTLVFAFLSAIGLILLLRTWFRANVSIIAAAVTLMTAQFIFLSQQGTPAIMMVFFSVYITLFAYLMVSSKETKSIVYAAALGVTVAIGLFTPLTIYIVLALLVGTALHPHTRFVVRKAGRVPVVTSLASALMLSIPLIYAAITHPDIIKSLIAPGLSSNITVVDNLELLAIQFFGFTGGFESSAILVPLYSFPVFLLAAIGIYSLAKRKHSVQNYILSAWLVIMIPILMLQPLNISIIFVPIALLIAVGIDFMLWYWYGLFPHNPYARLAGLIPVIVLVGGIVVMGASRYFYSFSYEPHVVNRFSNDINLLSDTLGDLDKPAILVVDKNEKRIYDLFAVANKIPLDVRTSSDGLFDKKTDESIVLATRKSTLVDSDRTPTRIIANSRAGHHSDRLYVYKNTAH